MGKKPIRRVVSSLQRACLEALESRSLLVSDPIITEFMASNSSTLTSKAVANLFPDWIEIHNTDPVNTLNLTGWYLAKSTSNSNLTRFLIPKKPDGTDTTIPPDGYMVVMASNQSGAGGYLTIPAANGGGYELHTNFNLGAGGDSAVLSKPVPDTINNRPVTIVSSYTWSSSPPPGGIGPQQQNVSYGTIDRTTILGPGSPATTFIPRDNSKGTGWIQRVYDDSTWTPGTTGIGYKTDEGFDNVIGTNVQPQMMNRAVGAYVRIPFNIPNPASFTSLNLTMQFQDGFVAYINGVEVARRNTPGTIAWNSAATRTVANATNGLPPIVDFDISSALSSLVTGTNILAIHGMNDSISSPDFLLNPQLSGVSTTPGTGFFTTPTPGAPNSAGVNNFVSDVFFDHDAGYYSSPFDLEIGTATAGATIRYTLDGTAPSLTNGITYSNPIHIGGSTRSTTIVRAAAFKNGLEPTAVFTQSYIFLSDVPVQSQSTLNPQMFPNTWILTSPDYNVDQSISLGATYGPGFINSIKSLPSISLVMDPDDLFGANGIYTHPESDGAGWTRAGSVEFLNPDGTLAFQTNAAVSMQGGTSRNPSNTHKHSFRLFFNGEFGSPTKMNYQLFKDSPVDAFDTVVLHAQFNNTWSQFDANQRARADYIRDQVVHDTIQAMGVPAPHGNYMNLYINGAFWGFYNPLERPDDSWAASYYGGNKDDWDIIHDQELTDGNLDRWNEMWAIAHNNSITADQRYEQIKPYLDISEFIDYMICEQYAGNIDWDGHNWFAGVNRVGLPNGDKTFKWWTWDSEHALQDVGDNVLNRNADFGPCRLFNQLIGSADFRQLFADHVQKSMFNNGALTPNAMISRYLSRANQISDAIVGESARWGDAFKTPAYNKTDWQNYINSRTVGPNSYFAQRTSVVLGQYRSKGWFAGTTLEAPSFSQYGGTINTGFGLTMTKSPTTVGNIYYTLDGTDPRLPGGNRAANAILYDGQVALNSSARVLARVQNGSSWSALTESTFLLSNRPQVRITEINYHPDAPAGSFIDDDYEFIEVQNTGPGSVNLQNFTLSGGINFTFPNFTLGAGGHAVVVSNLEAFESLYGTDVNVAGVFSGHLSNSGAQLKLAGALGETILDFFYNDSWHPSTDGDGKTLVINNPLDNSNNWGNAASWHASLDDEGTPGAGELPANQRVVVINELLTNPGTGNLRGDQIELYNSSNAPVDVDGWYLSDTLGIPKKYRINSNGGAINTVIPAGGYLVLSANENFDNPSDPGALIPFSFDKNGESVVLSSADDDELIGYQDIHEFAGAEVDVPFALYINSDGTDFFPESAVTFGGPNSVPLVGPIVINEIMYGPAGSDDEFVELKNITDSDVLLYDPANPNNTWQFTDAITFTFPTLHADPTPDNPNPVIPANGIALVVPIAPAAFRNKYNVPADIPIFGPYSGKLDNSGEKLELSRPGTPDGDVPYIVVDRINYQPNAPWPTTPAGTGPSLTRILPNVYGNDPVNWKAGPNKGNPGTDNSGVNQSPIVSAGASKIITLPTTGVTLNGIVQDDGLPVPAQLTSTWSIVSTPDGGDVAFGDINAPTTTATFTLPGVYVLKLTGNDGTFSTESTVQITVNQAPTADAGPDQYIPFQQFGVTSVTLSGSTDDADNLPNPPGGVTSTWSVLSSPDQAIVTFDNADSFTPEVTFSRSGIYVLRLTANDSAVATVDDVQIAIDGPATVNAGNDSSITQPTQQYLIQGDVDDDHVPTGPGVIPTVAKTWTLWDGPASVVFGDDSAEATTVTFTRAGIYTLRLTATEGQTTASDDVVITVVDAPLTPIGRTFLPPLDAPFTGVVGSFTDADPNGTADRFSATIDWGDGQTSPGQIVANGNGFDVLEDPGSSHAYTVVGPYNVSIVVNDIDGATTTIHSTAAAGDFPITVTLRPPVPTKDIPLNNIVIATFTDDDPAGEASDFTALIDWGDGQTSPGQIAALAGGGFEVRGSHTYLQSASNLTFKVQVNDVGGAFDSRTALINVALPAALVTDLVASNGKAYDLRNAAVGTPFYIDRSFTITSLPTDLVNGMLIRTANDDKGNTSANLVSFNVNSPATVYVAYDSRATRIPAWLSSFTLTSSTISQSTGPAYRIYSRAFAAGSVVTLGGNLQSPAAGAQSNYFAIVKSSVPVSPSTPANFTAIAGNQQIALSWDEAPGASTYNLYRSLTPGGQGTTPYRAGLTGTTFTDTGLTNGQIYYYTIAAVNAVGPSAPSIERSATPQAPVAALITNLVTTTGRTYDLRTATTGAAVYTDRAYTISSLSSALLNGTMIRTANDDKGNASANAMSFTVNSAATIYVAYDGRASRIPTWLSGFTLTSLTVTVPGSTSTPYKVYSLTVTGNTIVTLGGNLQSPAAGAQSNYFVIVQSGTTALPSVPSIPTGVTASQGNQQVTINWSPASGASTYNLYRSLTPGGQGATPYRTGLTGTSFTDTGLTNGQTYYYRLSSVNLVGESLPGAEVNATPQPLSGALVTNLTTTTGRTYDLRTATVGASVYIDRNFTISALNSTLTNGTLIRTANDDKANNTANAMSFTVTSAVTVYVAYDGRATRIPAWLSGFTLTAMTVTIPGSTSTPYKVYSLSVAANALVTLGGNLQSPASGAQSNYVVIVK